MGGLAGRECGGGAMRRLLEKGSTLGVREAHGSEARSLRRFGWERNLWDLEQDYWVCLVVW